MKKSTAIILLAVALLLVAAGIFLGVTEGFGSRKPEGGLLGADVTAIRANVGDVDLSFYSGSGDGLEVDIYGTESVSMSTDNGVLTITQGPESFWDRIRFFRRDRSQVVVWIPEGQVRTVTAETGNGNVDVNGLAADSTALEITSGSGEVSLYDSVFSSLSVSTGSGGVWTGGLTVRNGLSIKVSSGNINLSDTRAARAALSAASGDLWTGGLDAGEELTIKTASGEASLSQSGAKTVLVQTTSGDIWAEELYGSVSLEAASTSGDVSLTMPSTPKLRIDTTSGDVWCTLPGAREEYLVSAATGSGDVRGVHNDHGAGTKTVSVTTTSGDISLDYAG